MFVGKAGMDDESQTLWMGPLEPQNWAMLHTEGQQFFSKHFGLLCKKMFSKLFLFQDFVF